MHLQLNPIDLASMKRVVVIVDCALSYVAAQDPSNTVAEAKVAGDKIVADIKECLLAFRVQIIVAKGKEVVEKPIVFGFGGIGIVDGYGLEAICGVSEVEDSQWYHDENTAKQNQRFKMLDAALVRPRDGISEVTINLVLEPASGSRLRHGMCSSILASGSGSANNDVYLTVGGVSIETPGRKHCYLVLQRTRLRMQNDVLLFSCSA